MLKAFNPLRNSPVYSTSGSRICRVNPISGIPGPPPPPPPLATPLLQTPGNRTCFFPALVIHDQSPREIMFRVLGEANYDYCNTQCVSYFSQICGWTIFALNFNILVVNQTLLESCIGGQPSLLTGNLLRNLSDFTLCFRRAVCKIKQQGS